MSEKIYPGWLDSQKDYRFFIDEYQFIGKPFVFLDGKGRESVANYIKEKLNFDCFPIITDGSMDEFIAYGFFDDQVKLFRAPFDSSGIELIEIYDNFWSALRYVTSRIEERYITISRDIFD